MRIRFQAAFRPQPAVIPSLRGISLPLAATRCSQDPERISTTGDEFWPPHEYIPPGLAPKVLGGIEHMARTETLIASTTYQRWVLALTAGASLMVMLDV